MPEINPFRALRYDVARVGDLSKVVGQPYDKVDNRLREEYYARHPNHIIRIDRRQEESGERQYASAAEELDRWIREGVLVEEPEPALWAVRQSYRVDGKPRTRHGVCAMVRLEEFGKGRIHPHEETHAGPKVDRLKLLRAARAHIGHIFMLYPDPKRAIAAMLGRVMARPPDLEALDDFGERHEAWRIHDPGTVQALAGTMDSLEAIIADGHHRYETALAYKRECEAAGPLQDVPESARNVLATLIDMDDEGLTCFPTHRVIKDRPPLSEEEVRSKLQMDFDFKSFPFSGASEDYAARMQMLEWVRLKSSETPTFGLALPNVYMLLAVKKVAATAGRIASPNSLDWRSLDVNILHAVILEGKLGITPDDTAHERFVDYVRSADEAAERVRSGRAVAAFILNPVRMDQLKAVVRHGEKFPQKSTDFYPKMLSGFLMCRLRAGKT
jgi:uncharacterized protein (DUF1015 family)